MIVLHKLDLQIHLGMTEMLRCAIILYLVHSLGYEHLRFKKKTATGRWADGGGFPRGDYLYSRVGNCLRRLSRMVVNSRELASQILMSLGASVRMSAT